jgi:hypothetical protein
MHHSRTTALAVGFAVLALLLTAAAAIADSYVALGDSYSSGVGTKSFYESTCRRSEYAYPRLIARDRAGTSLTFRACSGATTSSVTSEQLGPLSSTTIVLGYPRLFMGVDCNAGTFFSTTEMSRMNGIADLLKTVTLERATAAGATFKDAIPPFVGHAICSSSEWLNGLSNPVEESFHPNRTGQSSGYEPLVRAVIG